MAFELARQLERVACLIIFDTTATDPTRERLERTELKLLADLVDFFEQLSGQLFSISREAIQAEAETAAAYALVMAAFQHSGVIFSKEAPWRSSRRCW